MRGLEERLGVRLLNRTWRSVASSAAGERLLAHLRPALDAIALGLEEVNVARGRRSGRLCLNVPRLAAMTVVAPVLARFASEYPDVALEVTEEDGLADIVAEGYDAGIRFGESVERDMVAVRVEPGPGDGRGGLAGLLRGLRHHACLRYRMRTSGALYRCS